jgi:hypothetical protein
VADFRTALLKGVGKKTSENFVKKAIECVDRMNGDELRYLIKACKKFSLQQAKFMDKADEYQKKQLNTLADEFHLSEEQINSNKPRDSFMKDRANFKALLETKIWPITKTANWAEFARVPVIERGLKEEHVANRKLKPSSTWLIYNKMYWMVAEGLAGVREMSARLNIIEILMPIYRACFVYSEEERTFKFVGKDTKALQPLGRAEAFDIIDMGSKKDFSTLSGHQGDMFAHALMPQVILQFQNQVLRQHRNSTDPVKKKEAYTIILYTAELCRKVINLSHMHQGLSLVDPSVVKLNKDGDFMTQYFEAYQYMHLLVRRSKSVIYGSARGAVTRSDLDSVTFDEDMYKFAANEMSIDLASIKLDF